MNSIVLSLALLTQIQPSWQNQQFGQPQFGGVNFNQAQAQTFPMPIGIYNIQFIIERNIFRKRVRGT